MAFIMLLYYDPCMESMNTESDVKTSASGFTLVEVLVAFAVFSLVIMSVFWSMIMADRLGQSARNRMYALQHARAVMEEITRIPYTDSDLAVGTHTVQRGGLTGQYVVTETVTNQFKQVLLTFDYESFDDLAQIELRTGVSRAFR
jgi:prepilin-type N-terminal cleavage/methylation domain-containing protein